MEWESDSPCCSHTYPGQGRRSPGRHSGWELEFSECGTVPGRGLLLTVERLRGCEGGDCGGNCLWRRAGQAWKQGDAAESRIGGGVTTMASLSLATASAAELLSVVLKLGAGTVIEDWERVSGITPLYMVICANSERSEGIKEEMNF